MTEIRYTDLEKHLEKPDIAPVYLLYGEEVLYKAAFETLLSKILTPSQRRLNLDALDNDAIHDAIERVNTFSLTGDPKVVALLDSRIFYSKTDDSALLQRAKAAYDENRLEKAAGYLLGLLGAKGIELSALTESPEPAKLLKSGSDLLQETRWLDELAAYCTEKELFPKKPKDELADLQIAIEKGFPPNHHLVITADLVDRRRTLYGAIRDRGMAIDCTVPKGNRKADQGARQAVLQERVRRTLSGLRKRLEPSAYRAMYDMLGFDLRGFSSSLEKLVSYVGDRESITAEDVEAVLKRTRQDPIYELTNALTDRDLGAALSFLASLLEEGLYPLQILAALTNGMRRLLMLKSFAESPEGRIWHNGISYNEFQARVVPAIGACDGELKLVLEKWEARLSSGEGGKKAKVDTDLLILKNPKSPYPVFLMLQKVDRYSREELLCALSRLQEADVRLKSTGQNPRLILESTLINSLQRE